MSKAKSDIKQVLELEISHFLAVGHWKATHSPAESPPGTLLICPPSSWCSTPNAIEASPKSLNLIYAIVTDDIQILRLEMFDSRR
jgi:hypothetical protein